MDTFEAIRSRTSVRSFAPGAIARDDIARLLDAAVRAPNHKLTEPWRFVVVTGAARDRYAAIRRDHRKLKFDDPAAPDAAAKIETTWREHLDTPAFIFVLQALDDDAVRREEDYAAVMMATQNLLLAATALGLGSYLRTGGIMGRPEVRELAGAAERERIVAIVSVGRPAGPATPVRRTGAAAKTTWLD